MTVRLAFFTIILAVILLNCSILALENDFDLKLLVEVTRHGQRAPEKIFDLSLNPEDNFQVPHNLTHAGA